MVDNMMAMLVFAAGSAAVMSGIHQQIRLNADGSEMTVATTLARNVFEELRRRDPEEYLVTGMPRGEMGPLDGSGQPSPSGRYFVEWDYTDDIPSSGLKTVEITVRWTGDDKAREFTFISAVRAPRTRPWGVMLPWTGYTPEMLSYGDCRQVVTDDTPTPVPPPPETPPPSDSNGNGKAKGKNK